VSVDERRAALERGAIAERWVADRLVEDGWSVLARNWRGGNGELDVVVERDGVVRFVEVKARDADDPNGVDAVGVAKRARLGSAARAWLLEQAGEPREVAFLVALVSVDGDRLDVEWIDDAFDVAGG
jgi:putative endonuclease